MGRIRRNPEGQRLRESLEASNKLALALIETKQANRVTIEVTEHYTNVQIQLGRGSGWTGEYLHKLQEFLYEHGAKMIFQNEHDGVQLLIWPYDPKENDGQHS